MTLLWNAIKNHIQAFEWYYWRLVHQWWFLLFWLSFDCFWPFLTNGTLFQSSKTLKTIGVPIITGLPRLYQQCTNPQNSQKTVKTAKMTVGVTNRHMSTQSPPNTQSPRPPPPSASAEYTKPVRAYQSHRLERVVPTGPITCSSCWLV